MSQERKNGGGGRLQRQVGVGGAIVLGLGSIVGTGVYVSLGLAAGAAGPGVLLAVLIAAAVAMCNGLSSAQLAAAHPVAGGTYEYGYRYLHPALGRIAGWMFLAAKSASAATAALGFAGYLLTAVAPEHHAWGRGLALLAVLVLTGLVISGLRRTNAVNAIIVAVALGALAFFVVAVGRNVGGQGMTRLTDMKGYTSWVNDAGQSFVPAMLHGAALVFVAYTGYGRVATLGEEIKDPRKSIPISVILTLLLSAAIYFAVAGVAVAAVGAEGYGRLAVAGKAPLESIAGSYNASWRIVLVIGAVTAMLGVLLNLILGLSRVVLAMGRRGDLPSIFANVNAAGTTPTPAVLLVAGVIAVLALIGSIKLAWSLSATTVLVYYALTNLAALRLPPEDRRYPRVIPVLGLLGCLALAAFVSWPYLAGAAAVVVGSLLWHAMWSRLRG